MDDNGLWYINRLLRAKMELVKAELMVKLLALQPVVRFTL